MLSVAVVVVICCLLLFVVVIAVAVLAVPAAIYYLCSSVFCRRYLCFEKMSLKNAIAMALRDTADRLESRYHCLAPPSEKTRFSKLRFSRCYEREGDYFARWNQRVDWRRTRKSSSAARPPVKRRGGVIQQLDQRSLPRTRKSAARARSDSRRRKVLMRSSAKTRKSDYDAIAFLMQVLQQEELSSDLVADCKWVSR